MRADNINYCQWHNGNLMACCTTMSATDPVTVKPQPRLLRVAVVEDDPTLRLFVTKLLGKAENRFELAGSWESAEAAVRTLVETQPDAVVVDLELPGASGVDLIKELSPRMINTAFVVLTIHDDSKKVFSALKAGANGYLLKSARPSEIAAGIRQACDGGAPLSQDIARLLIQSFQEPMKAEKKPMPGLTPRESQILELLAQGMVPKEVGEELHISYETVRDYLKSVYLKLHVRSRTEAVIKYLQHADS
jgi:DNA-binding NarL/FixJ family response regulator